MMGVVYAEMAIVGGILLATTAQVFGVIDIEN